MLRAGNRRIKLSSLTAFSHAQEHLREQTAHGAIVTIIGVCIALVLFVSEARQCMTTKRVQEMKVDSTRSEELHITFNISFPALPCEALLLDAGDASGRWQTESRMTLARNGEVHKHQTDSQGRWLRLAEYTAPSGGEWDNPFVLRVDQQEMSEIAEALKRHEGCNIHGWVEVARVAGNLHFAVRPEAMFLAMNVQEIMQVLRMRQFMNGVAGDMHADASKLNISHVIHELRFGARFPGQANPLEGTAQVDRLATGIDKYFIKVVPTDYYTLWGWKKHSYQYSVTEYYHRFTGGEEQPPAVYLLYDTSPIMVELREVRPGLLRLLVRVCAVVGGAFALTGMFDKMVHRAVRTVTKRHHTA